MKKLTIDPVLYKKIHNRLIDIVFQEQLSHLSSCVTTLPILVGIYGMKRTNDVVILSNGHAGLAQYLCLEEFEGKDALGLLNRHGIHPGRNPEDGIFCSTGSLGLGLPIAIGAALADKNIHVYCVISDGECCEGSIWESLYFLSKRTIPNLTVFVNANGISAYDFININKLKKIIKSFNCRNVNTINTEKYLQTFPALFEKGIESHYCKVLIPKNLKYEI